MQAKIEINEVKSIDREIQVDASQTDCMIYDQRGDWDNHVWIGERAKDQLLNWLFDRVDRIDGQYCWTVLLNGRRGYLFCEYNREDGITGIRFACRYPRIRKAKPVIDPEWERWERYNRTEALRAEFEAIEQKCHELFRLGSPIHITATRMRGCCARAPWITLATPQPSTGGTLTAWSTGSALSRACRASCATLARGCGAGSLRSASSSNPTTSDNFSTSRKSKPI